MLVSKEFMNKLKDFGLNSYEIKLWVALLSKGTATAGDLSDIANVPRSRTYDVLETLEKKGFVIMKLGKPIKYLAIPPSEVIERVKKKVEEEAEGQNQMLDKLSKSAVLKELVSLHKNGIEQVDPVDLTGILKGRENIYARLNSMVKEAKKSVRICTTATGASRKSASLRHAFNRAIAKNVKVQVISPKEMDFHGVDARQAKIDTRYVVVDGNRVMIMVPDENIHEHYDFGIVVNEAKFAQGFEKLFEENWKRATA
ncbi:hypothetical protein CMO91_05505 [Candidatus Woesearchaeota archaeon]|nr:hypothetical protein [Candidatus Woesearchaeota archaeon]|tara:strand:- start:375 stop:1142 length:768 start_codon:yes stop_codon:yes gene_type:complete